MSGDPKIAVQLRVMKRTEMVGPRADALSMSVTCDVLVHHEVPIRHCEVPIRQCGTLMSEFWIKLL